MVHTMTPVNDPNLIAQLEGSGGMKPVMDPALISQLEGNQSSANQNMNPIIRMASDIDVGGAKFGTNLLNSLQNMVGAGTFGKNRIGQVPDYSSAYAPQNPNIADKLIQGASQYAPYEAVSAGLPLSGLSNLATTGAAFGATQSQNPMAGALTGAATNTGVGLLGKTADPILNYLSKYAAQGLTKQTGNILDAGKAVSNQQAFDMAKQNYGALSQQEGNAWDNLKQQAAAADATKRYTANFAPASSMPVLPGGPETLSATQMPTFDNSGYVGSLSDQLNKLKQQSGAQSGFARANKDSEKLLQDYIGDQHNTFSDAIQHNQALNQDFQNEIAPGQPLPFRTVNFAKTNLKNSINQNIQNSGLQDTLGSAWNNANQITSQKNQIFNNVVNPKGIEQISTFSTMMNGKNPNADPTSFVNDYLPTSRGDGTQKMQQFSQMVGDQNTAKNVLKQNYFDKAIQSGTVEPRTFLSKYNNLSDDQQGYLFSPQENQTIQALNKINQDHPDALSKSQWGGFGHHSIAATLGGILGMSTGHGLWEGLGAGILGGVAANAGLRKLFENPSISNYFVNALTKPAAAGAPGTFNPLLRSLITPQATSLFGGSQ